MGAGCTTPWGGSGSQDGLLFFKRYLSQISNRKLKISISHDVVILALEPDTVLKGNALSKLKKNTFRRINPINYGIAPNKIGLEYEILI